MPRGRQGVSSSIFRPWSGTDQKHMFGDEIPIVPSYRGTICDTKRLTQCIPQYLLDI